MNKIIIPTPLRKFTNNESSYFTSQDRVDLAMEDLAKAFPDIRVHLFDETEQFRSFINIFVGQEDIRGLQKGQTPLSGSETISIIPAIAGGIL